MNLEKVIYKIINKESIKDSEELFDFVNGSHENAKAYIRHKNLWALLQTGNEMDKEAINSGYKVVKRNIQNRKKTFLLQVIKYAAIIVFAIMGGYLINFVDLKNDVAMNEIFVPKGNRTSVILPDSTKVWLSNGTCLIYPETFIGGFRSVRLEGEGFFEVSHDKKHPFIVNVGEHRIKVLGTKFAVVAYPEDQEVKTELVSGKIQFDIKKGESSNDYSSFEVKPKYGLTYDKNSGKIYESIIPDSFYDYWLKGVYRFKDENFHSLALKIERIYNLEVDFEDEELKSRLFTGTLSVDDNIYTIMEVFKGASGEPFNYTFEKGKIYIKNIK